MLRGIGWVFLSLTPSLGSCGGLTHLVWKSATAGAQRSGTAWLTVEEVYWHETSNAPVLRYSVRVPDRSLYDQLPDRGWLQLHDRGHGAALRARLSRPGVTRFAVVRRRQGGRVRWRAWTRGLGWYWNVSVLTRPPDAAALTKIELGRIASDIEVEHFERNHRWLMILQGCALTVPAVVGDVAIQAMEGVLEMALDPETWIDAATSIHDHSHDRSHRRSRSESRGTPTRRPRDKPGGRPKLNPRRAKQRDAQTTTRRVAGR